MAEALEIRICYLLSELTADALEILRTLNSARAVAARPFKPFLNGFYNLFVRIKFYSQQRHILIIFILRIPAEILLCARISVSQTPAAEYPAQE